MGDHGFRSQPEMHFRCIQYAGRKEYCRLAGIAGDHGLGQLLDEAVCLHTQFAGG